MTTDELQSKTISFLRFPLIVGVVLIHTNLDNVVFNGVNIMEGGNFPIYSTIFHLFSQIIARIAVPLFFFISGFLFFYKTDRFTAQTYTKKLQKRVKTILIPYIIWNFLVIAFFFLAQTFIPELMSGTNKLIVDYTFADWLWAFWDTAKYNISGGGSPICYQFWFIRDLMVVMLCSPLLHFLIKKLHHYAVILLGILWLFGWWFNIVGFSITAFFFFSAGAYFSIHKKNFVELMKPLFPYATTTYAVIAIIELCFGGTTWCRYLHSIGIVVGIIAAITLTAHFINLGKWKASTFLAGSSFFIYAYHAMPLAFVIKFCFKLIQPQSDMMLVFLYVLCPTITICIGLLIYRLLKHLLPKTTALITGRR